MKNLAISFLALLFFTQSSFAYQPRSLNELIYEFQYATEVEWDQQDSAFLARQEQLLAEGIRELIKAGKTPQALMTETLDMIPNEQFKADVQKSLKLSQTQQWSAEDLRAFILASAQKTQQQGAHWSVVAKVAVGVALGLVVARLAVEIYFHEWEKRF